jgi:hypothetical protein
VVAAFGIVVGVMTHLVRIKTYQPGPEITEIAVFGELEQCKARKYFSVKQHIFFLTY